MGQMDSEFETASWYAPAAAQMWCSAYLFHRSLPRFQNQPAEDRLLDEMARTKYVLRKDVVAPGYTGHCEEVYEGTESTTRSEETFPVLIAGGIVRYHP